MTMLNFFFKGGTICGLISEKNFFLQIGWFWYLGVLDTRNRLEQVPSFEKFSWSPKFLSKNSKIEPFFFKNRNFFSKIEIFTKKFRGSWKIFRNSGLAPIVFSCPKNSEYQKSVNLEKKIFSRSGLDLYPPLKFLPLRFHTWFVVAPDSGSTKFSEYCLVIIAFQLLLLIANIGGLVQLKHNYLIKKFDF